MWSALLDWVYPPKCAVCRLIGEKSPCDQCLQGLIREDLRYLRLGPELDESRSIYRYNEVAAQMVKALKYHRQTSLESWVSAQILDAFESWYEPFDAIVPVPIHQTRLANRGFNQAELLAAELPKDLIQLDLVRTRRTKPQAQISRSQRQTSLAGAFDCPVSLVGKRVLLIDDVITTGATAIECAKALREAGALWVGVRTFAGRKR